MAVVGAYPCPACGQLIFTAMGSKDPLLAPYAKKHVCKTPPNKGETPLPNLVR